jgi:hypothetical protein
MTMSEQRQDQNIGQIREVLAKASPEQIRRLIEDIRKPAVQERTQ